MRYVKMPYVKCAMSNNNVKILFQISIEFRNKH